MKTLLFFMLSCCCFISSSAETFGAKVPGGVKALQNTVVDIIVSKNEDSSDNKLQNSNGAGFIFSEDGYIATNCHVIDNCDSIKVVTYDNKVYQTKIIGKDKHFDIAVLKINIPAGIKLPYVKFADSDKVKTCDQVAAIGNPMNLSRNVATGTVSNDKMDLSKQISDQEFDYGDSIGEYIPFNAPVTYGNSGGPLFSESGEVIGMVTVFMIDGANIVGIGFAIPSNKLKKVVESLRTLGKMPRGWLGISFDRMPVETDKNSTTDYPYVAMVAENSPAKSAGIRPGDFITSINGINVSKVVNLYNIESNLPVGSVIPVQIVRDERKIMLSMTVGAKNDDDSLYADGDEENGRSFPSENILKLGFEVADLTKEIRETFKIPANENGAFVSSSDNDLFGNIVQKVEHKAIKNVKDLKEAIANLQGKITLLTYDPLTQKSSYVIIECKK